MSLATLPKSKTVEVELGYWPTEKQIVLHESPARYKLFGGAMGGGKSVYLCQEGLRLSLKYPGNVGFMGRRDLDDFKKTTLVTLLDEVIPSELIVNHNKSDHIIYLLNGSKIIYGELKDTESLKSLNLGWFAIDEATEASYEAFLMLDSRLRRKIEGIKYFGLLASNPEPGWVKKLFVDVKKPNYHFVPALPSDNPNLPLDYEAKLRESFPDIWVKRYLEGDWSAFEGQVYPEFSRNTHVIPSFEMPATWEKYGSIDHGQTAPTSCHEYAVDYDGNVFVTKEYYVSGKIVADHAKALLEMGYANWHMAWIDPSCAYKTLQRATGFYSVCDEYLENGIMTTPSNHDLRAGINRVSEYLKVNPSSLHPLTQEKGSPRIFIFDTCTELIDELENYRWEDVKPGTEPKDKPKEGQKDHAVSELRYFLITRPSPSKDPEVERQKLREPTIEEKCAKVIEERRFEKSLDDMMGDEF